MLSEYCKEFYSCSGQLQLLTVPGPLAPHTLKSGGARAHPEYMAPAPMQRTFNKRQIIFRYINSTFRQLYCLKF